MRTPPAPPGRRALRSCRRTGLITAGLITAGLRRHGQLWAGKLLPWLWIELDASEQR